MLKINGQNYIIHRNEGLFFQLILFFSTFTAAKMLEMTIKPLAIFVIPFLFWALASCQDTSVPKEEEEIPVDTLSVWSTFRKNENWLQ